MINMKNLDPNNIKIDEKSYKNILIYISYVTPNSVKPLYFIINNANGCIEESNGYKYLTLVLTDESKDKLNRHKKIWRNIKDLTRWTNNN